MTYTTKDIEGVLGEITDKVNPAIYELLTTSVGEKYREIAKYQISCGGKRLRPALAIISSKMFGGRIEDVLYPAASLEILHNATLIIDDIIDHSDFRRNELTTWKKFGTSMAECFSMTYVASVFEGANRSPKRSDLIDLFSETLKNIVDGEVDDILFERSGRENEPFVVHSRYEKVSREDYLKMVKKKTASLISASCQVGAICAHASSEQTEALKEFGSNIGIAFQVRDDVLDLFGDEKGFGKKIGNDIIERKMGNIVIIFALEELKSRDKDSLLKILCGVEPVKDKDVRKAIRIISQTEAQNKALKLGKIYIDEASRCLQKLPQNDSSTSLKELADFILDRRY